MKTSSMVSDLMLTTNVLETDNVLLFQYMQDISTL